MALSCVTRAQCSKPQNTNWVSTQTINIILADYSKIGGEIEKYLLYIV